MAPISADDVICYLEKNPGFFIEHPDSLRQSGLLTQDSASAKVLNLRDKLFDRLKGEREDLIRLLDETIEIVRQNEQIEKDFIAIEQLLFEQAPSLAQPYGNRKEHRIALWNRIRGLFTSGTYRRHSSYRGKI